MTKLSINLDKIPEGRIKQSKTGRGRYVDIVLFKNRDGKDEWGNDGFCSIDVTKEQREEGDRGEIIGNWKELGTGASRPPVTQPQKTRRAEPE